MGEDVKHYMLAWEVKSRCRGNGPTTDREEKVTCAACRKTIK